MKRFYERDLIKMKPPRGYVTWTEEAITVMLKEKGFIDFEIETIDGQRVWIEREKESVKPPEEKPIEETPFGSVKNIEPVDWPDTNTEVLKGKIEKQPETEKPIEKKTKPAAKKKTTTRRRKKPRKK